MAENTDVLLIQRVQEGSEDAFNELYEKYYRLVYFIAFEMCHNDADAKDILQDTFVQIRQSIKNLQDRENFKPWLNRIVINKCKNMFRSRRTVEMNQDDLWYQLHINEGRSYMLPEASLHKKNDQEIVHELLSQLSVQQREVLIMRYFEHMSMKEMAEILNVPEGTIKTRLMYGKNHLKKLILTYEKETGTKIDFYVEDASLMLLFAYLFQQGITYPPYTKPNKKKNVNDFHVSNGIWNGAIALLSAVLLTSGYMVFKTMQNEEGQSEDQKANITVIRSDARANYFYLMDWACCKDDMLTKTKEEFDMVMPVYRRMIHTESEYLERLKSDHWIQDFEAIYQQL